MPSEPPRPNGYHRLQAPRAVRHLVNDHQWAEAVVSSRPRPVEPLPTRGRHLARAGGLGMNWASHPVAKVRLAVNNQRRKKQGLAAPVRKASPAENERRKAVRDAGFDPVEVDADFWWRTVRGERRTKLEREVIRWVFEHPPPRSPSSSPQALVEEDRPASVVGSDDLDPPSPASSASSVPEPEGGNPVRVGSSTVTARAGPRRQKAGLDRLELPAVEMVAPVYHDSLPSFQASGELGLGDLGEDGGAGYEEEREEEISPRDTLPRRIKRRLSSYFSLRSSRSRSRSNDPSPPLPQPPVFPPRDPSPPPPLPQTETTDTRRPPPIEPKMSPSAASPTSSTFEPAPRAYSIYEPLPRTLAEWNELPRRMSTPIVNSPPSSQREGTPNPNARSDVYWDVHDGGRYTLGTGVYRSPEPQVKEEEEEGEGSGV